MADNTYTSPQSSKRDAIRFILSDTGKNGSWLFSDQEIEYVLADNGGDVYRAAAELAVIQSGKYTDRRDKTVGPLSIKYGEIADRWTKLANSIKARGSSKSGAVAIMTQRTGRGPHFRLGIHDIAQPLDPRLSYDAIFGRDDDIDGGDLDAQ